MKSLIKSIRIYANMTQEEFALSIGTTTLSINRWENGKSIPNKMAQKQLYNFCKEHNIDVTTLITNNKTHKESNNKLILYHASKKGIIGKIKPLSRNECDFGKGFYMGTNVLQPLTLVCNESKPILYTLELDLTGLKVLNIKINIDWAMLIAYNRKEMENVKGTPIYEKYANLTKQYDIITGCIADDRMYVELSKFFNKYLTDVALINCLSALELGNQYVAISEKACNQIKIIKEEPLTELELLLLRDISINRRKKGIAITEEIEIKYRRVGKFFDEILKGE